MQPGCTKVRILLVTMLFLISLALIPRCHASGSTIYVDDSNTTGPWDGTENHPYETITDALAAATSGDTVLVSSGTYNEKIVITKNLYLVGENKETTFLDGGQNGHVLYAHEPTNSIIQVEVSGFTIRNAGGSGFDCVAFSYVSNGRIQDCRMIYSEEGEGVQLDHCHGIHILDNYIANNKVSGISLTLSEQNVIEGNTIQGNQKGVYLSSLSTENTISANTIRQNTQYGVYILQSSSNVLFFNDFTENNQNAYDAATNTWSQSSQGNYWGDYNDYDTNGDGIGDTPYQIPGGANQDAYPLGYFLQQPAPPGQNQAPTAVSLSISPSSADLGDTVSFSGQGTDTDGYITGYQWQSSLDGILSTQQAFTTSTLSVGTHTISFKVQDNQGAWSSEKTSSITIDLGVNQPPTAVIDSIAPNPAQQGQAVLFQGHGVDADGAIVAYKWLSTIDGVIGTTASFSTTTLSRGTHTIYFQVKDDIEWSSQVTCPVEITKNTSQGGGQNQAPVADIGGPYLGDVYESIVFNASGSADEDGDIVSALWHFGDNTSGVGLIQPHVYTTAGTYTVTLEVTDDEGATTTASCTVVIGQQGSQGGQSGLFPELNLEIPFPLLVICAFASILGVIGGFLVWLKRR